MFGQKSESFIKVFLAGRTMISAFTVMKEGMFSHKREIFDHGGTIIMDFIGKGMAMRASMRFTF